MKVISKGKGWKVNKTCRGCQAILEIESNDIQYELSDAQATSQHYEVEVEGTYFVECPECGLKLKFKSQDIPKPIKDKFR